MKKAKKKRKEEENISCKNYIRKLFLQVYLIFATLS